MKLGPLKRYETELKHWIYQYAYENYWSPPLIEKVECDWHGEVFDVADIDTNLHHDVWQDLKTLDILKYIRRYCDKFVILPDVFSESPVPITTERNQFDMDRKNIVFINGKIWELAIKDIKYHYIYNHNRHTYIFFDSATGGGLYITPEGKTPQMKVLTLFTDGFIIEDVQNTEKWWTMTNDWYGLELTDEDTIATDHSKAKSGIYIHAPYMEFNYDEEVTEEKEPVIHGLMSQSKDQWIRPKWYFLLQNQTFIHNEKILFTNTALVIYKDGTYHIENTYLFDKGKHVEKIDKHTIRIYHDNSISKIIFFLRPYSQVRWTKPDSLYYAATKENVYSTLVMRVKRKTTNSLLNYMNWNMDKSIEDMIEWGYKYDRDILVTIQNFFPRLIKLSKHDDIQILRSYNNEVFYKPKFMITVENKLQAYPSLFIDHKLYMGDYRIIKSDEADHLIIDPERFWKAIGFTPSEFVQPTQKTRVARGTPEPPYEPPQNYVDPYKDMDWLKENLLASINDIRVIHTGFKPLNEEKVSYQGGRIFKTPLRKDLIVDTFGDTAYEFGGYPFANGYLTTDYITDKIFRRFDNVNIFGFGDLDFTVTNNTNPEDTDVFIPGERTTYYNGMSPTLLINRTTEPLNGITRLWMNGPVQEHVVDYYNHDIPSLGSDKTYKVGQTVAFDKYGYECTDQIEVVCNHYINFDFVYNYLHDTHYGVSEHPVISLFDLKLIDTRRDYNLEIDPDRVNTSFNVGSFNENCMTDADIRALFNPNEAGETKTIPITLKSNAQLLGEKILTRYYLGIRGTITNRKQFRTEVTPLNGTFVNADGTVGTIPDVCKDFATDTIYNKEPIILRMLSESSVSQMLAEAGVNYIKYKGVVIDSGDSYTATLTEREHAHLDQKNKTLILRVNSDIDLDRSVNGIQPDTGEIDPPITGDLKLVDITSDPESVKHGSENVVTLHFDYV